MPPGQDDNTALLYNYEVLKAKLEIRELFLDNVVKEIYEQIGQTLTLVRVQLAAFEAGGSCRENSSMSTPSDLVGQSIRDLKIMCRNFYPDKDLLKKNDFHQGLAIIMQVLGIDFRNKSLIDGTVLELPADLQLFVANMIREIIISLQKASANMEELLFNYTSGRVTIVLIYKGKTINWSPDAEHDRQVKLAIPDRAKLINASFSTKAFKSGLKKLTLAIPLITD